MKPRRLRSQAFRLWRLALGRTVFAGGATALRGLLRAVRGRRTASLEAAFDAGFYLQQVQPEAMRRRAARDPVLHYLMIGRRMGLTPDPGFDPLFYRHANPELPRGVDLYRHYLEIGRGQGRAPSLASTRTARWAIAGTGGRSALLINHNRGGGSAHLLGLHADRLAGEGWGVLEAVKVGMTGQTVSLEMPEGTRCFDLLAGEDAFVAFARAAGVRRIVLNHLIDFPEAMFDWAPRVAARLDGDYEVMLHDYFYACLRTDPVDRWGKFCGLAGVDLCYSCLGRREGWPGPEPGRWRAQSAKLLAGAALVTAPSEDLASRLGGAFPGVGIRVVEPETVLPAPERRVPIAPEEPYRILILGALNQQKGAHVILDLAHVIRAAELPITLTVLGPTSENEGLAAAGVTLLGRYRDQDAPAHLARLKPHRVFLPSICPETWSFTLSVALRAGAPVAVFDIGAPAARLRRLNRGLILPYMLHDRPQALAQAFLDDRAALLPRKRPVSSRPGPRG